MIYWIGNSENWDKPIHPTGPLDDGTLAGDAKNRHVFPLVEETVLEVAFSPLYSIYKRLSKYAAVNCTSRFALRSALPHELNPKWVDWHHFDNGLVVKAPASCQNQGIRFALPNEYSRRLAEYDHIVGNIGVVEQYLPGPQYEADGIVVDGKIHLLAWTLQEGENGNIVRYLPAPFPESPTFPKAPTEAIETVVKALRLDNCPFCFEMKRETDEQGGWKIIDAHARLGEDRRLWTDQAALFDQVDRIISG